MSLVGGATQPRPHKLERSDGFYGLTRNPATLTFAHHSLRRRWHTMHVNCLDVPRAQGHIEDIKAKYGDASNAYRVRVLGGFPTSDDETVIPLELVLGAVGRNVS